ncbi:MAG TPA: DUF58 domain-containing protein [bacterium]|jgi:uncharacterized protein (DUF58 family)
MGNPDVKPAKVAVDSEFLNKLGRLKIETRKILAGVMKGDKRSRAYGTSVEFADYRDYHRGDDLRYLDWNIYARLERFFLKLFHEEEDLTVHILVDVSLSMETGEPNKSTYARKLAACLSYIALSNLDRISVTSFADGIQKGTQLLRGKGHFGIVVEMLNSVVSESSTDFEASVKEFNLRQRSKGLVFVISDFLDPVKLKDGLKRLAYRKHDIVLIQVLDKNEIDPELRGDWALTDIETGEIIEVSISPRLLSDYKRKMVAYLKDLKSFASKMHAGYVLVTTDIDVEDFILKELAFAGYVR